MFDYKTPADASTSHSTRKPTHSSSLSEHIVLNMSSFSVTTLHALLELPYYK